MDLSAVGPPNDDSQKRPARSGDTAVKTGPIRRLCARIIAVVDRWGPDVAAEEPRHHHSGVMTARFAFLGACFALLLAPVFWYSYPDEPQIALINVVYSGLLLLTPVLMKKVGSTEAAAHWLLANAFAIIAYETVLLGGVESTAFVWFVALPFCAAIFGGRRCAAVWGCTTALAMVSIVALQLHGWIGEGTSATRMVAVRGASVAALALMVGYFAWLQEKDIGGLVENLAEERGRFRNAAIRDPLTGLLNRSLLADHLSRILARTRRSGTSGALYYGDLDGFKEVNDAWGHYVGDLLLKGVAERLRSETRDCDIVMRVGGDEFVLLVEELADRKVAAGVAEKVVALVQRPFDIDGQPVSVGLSLGIVMIEGQLSRPDQLLDAADSAMYAAKRGGKAFSFA